MQGAALTAQAEDGGQMKIKRENIPSHTYAENTKITITTVHYYSKIRSKKMCTCYCSPLTPQFKSRYFSSPFSIDPGVNYIVVIVRPPKRNYEEEAYTTRIQKEKLHVKHTFTGVPLKKQSCPKF